jgi:hypothetical protein
MKPGDIVRTRHDLTPLNDMPIPMGTRFRLVHYRDTSHGRRWTGDDTQGWWIYDLPEDALEVIV